MSANNPQSLFSILVISCVLATMTSPNSTAAVAQNNDSSMDSVFSDNATSKTDQKGTRVRKSASAATKTTVGAEGENSTKGADAASDEADDPDGHGKRNMIGIPRPRRRAPATPLMTVESFAKSSIVQGTAWPGIGPFNPSKDDDSLIDKNHDSIKIESSDQKQITAVELLLVDHGATDFTGVEMTSDFLLESLGTRPARIADFNIALEKAKPAIFQKHRTATLTAGRYKVSMKPVMTEDSKSLTIRVESTAPVVVVDPSDETAPPAPRGPATVLHKQLSHLGEIFTKIKPIPEEASTVKTNTVIESPAPGEKTSTPSVSSKTANTPEALKASFKELVQNWQKIKRNAVKNRDISELPNVLSGNALRIQTGGIKWLASKHQFYEMVPKAVEIGTVTELVKDKKYAVVATVQESSKMFDDQTNQLLREAEDTYHVSYTVEKLGDKFVISDSSIIKLGQPSGQQPAPAANKKP